MKNRSWQARRWAPRRWMAVTAVALTTAWGSLGVSQANAAKVAVLSLKPLDALVADVEYLLKATGTSPIGAFFLPQVRAFTEGIDGTRPIGVAVTVEGDTFNAIGFVPTTDLKAILAKLEPMLGRTTDAGDGVLELQGPQPVFIKERRGWAFIGQSPESLKQLPNDPVDLLEDLPNRFDLGIKAYVKNVPDPYKQMLVGQIREGIQRTMRDDPEGAEAQIRQIEKAIGESDTIDMGWQVDSKQQETHFEMVVKPLPGTEMAKQVKSMVDAKTEFSGFLVDDAAVRGNFAGVILPGQVEQALASINRVEQKMAEEIEEDEDLDEGTRAAAKQLVGTFFRIATSTIKTGRMDSCTSVVLKPKTMTLISAGHVADGSEVESAVKQLVAAAKNQKDLKFSSVRFNAATHAGVNFHTLALPIPEEEYARKVMGETLEVAIGTGKTQAYVAIGANGVNLLRKAIDQSKSGGSSVDPVFGEVSVMPILQFAESIEPNPLLRSLAAVLEDVPDRLHFRAVERKGGAAYRLTIEEGVLSVLGQGAQAAGVNGGF